MPTRRPAVDPIAALSKRRFNISYVSHARSILIGEFGTALAELAQVLDELSLPISEIIGSGGGETKFTQRTRRALTERGWVKHNFVISRTIDGKVRESTSHEVDHVKIVGGVGTIGCEIEWNNKDPFFDRDLENFKRLHSEGAISAGVIITRGQSLQSQMSSLVARFARDRRIDSFDALQREGIRPTPKQEKAISKRVGRSRDPVPFADAWTSNFVSNKFGAATTHWDKLLARVDRGVGNPCPLLLIGLPAEIVEFDRAVVDQLDDNEGATPPE